MIVLHALQRCETRSIGKTVCGHVGLRVKTHATGRRRYKGKNFVTAAPGEQPTCQRCLFVISKGERRGRDTYRAQPYESVGARAD